MDKPLDSASNEAAYSYAFVLALAAHLGKVEDRFLALPEEPGQSVDKTIWAQETSTNLRLVRQLALAELATHYRQQDVALHGAQPQLALSSQLESHLLGPQREDLNHTSTADILAAVDTDAPFVAASLLRNAQGERLHAVLLDAVRIVAGDVRSADELFAATSAALANYLAASVQQADLLLDFDKLSLYIDAVVDYLEPLLRIAVPQVFRTFKIVLQGQIAAARGAASLLAVLKLRELGNNLMAKCAYPQAVKVYTQAIDLCDYSSNNNLAQLYTNRAIAFVGLNCYAEAVCDLNRALQADRTFTPAWAQLGYCHLYLGAGYLALRCYLTALRALAGEIYPENFPEDLKDDYTRAKVQTVMPQFVQRLVLSIILTERRAEQQREPALSIQEATTRVRAILARLRAAANPEDLHYFSYLYDEDFETMRATATRANRTRPSILTPDVAQDIMASTNVEATAVALPVGARTNPVQRNTTTTTAGGELTTARATTTTGPNPAPGAAAPASGVPNLRGIFNNLGEIFGDVIQAHTLTLTGTQPPLNSHSTQRPLASALPDASDQPTPEGQAPVDFIGGALSAAEQALQGNSDGAQSESAPGTPGTPGQQVPPTMLPHMPGAYHPAMRQHFEAVRNLQEQQRQQQERRRTQNQGPRPAGQPGTVHRVVRQIFVPGRRPQQVEVRDIRMPSSQHSNLASPTLSIANSEPPRTSRTQSPIERSDTDMPDAPDVD